MPVVSALEGCNKYGPNNDDNERLKDEKVLNLLVIS